MHVAIFTVGSNPLPVYTVAKYLLLHNRSDSEELPKPDVFVFVYTSETEEFYRNIRRKLGSLETVAVEEVNLGEKERDSEWVMESLALKLSNLIQKGPNISTVHLHFTGGTKPMSVYSYAVVKKFVEERNVKGIFSDLDPDDAVITIGSKTYPFNNKGNSDVNNRITDLSAYVQLSIKDIFELHDMKLKISDDSLTFKEMDIVSFSKTAASTRGEWIETINKMKNGLEKYRERKKNPKIHLPKQEIQKDRNLFVTISNTFKHLMPVNWEQVSNEPKLYTDFIEFFHGKWLEDYIFYAIQSLKQNNDRIRPLTEVLKNVEASYKGRPCEVDVIAMQGYRMFLFSCTTSNEIDRVKGKAFEALYRAEQLGGAHARVIVVSMLPSSTEINDLEKDLSSFDAKLNKRCAAIGVQELKNFDKLKDKLIEIFST